MVEKQKKVDTSLPSEHGILEEVHALAEGGLTINEAHGHAERLGHVVSALEAIHRLVSHSLGKGEAEAPTVEEV